MDLPLGDWLHCLPYLLSSSPTLYPSISQLFPSPGGVSLSPSESSLPTIPSSQSPPDLDVDVAPDQPDLALAQSGSLPVSHAVSITSSLPINNSAHVLQCHGHINTYPQPLAPR
ncbi:hypothetical protein FF2_044633 [Malus domestica]